MLSLFAAAIDREYKYLNIVDVTPKEGVAPVSKEEVAKKMAKGTSIDKMTISTVPDPTPAMQTVIDITKKHAELVLEASAIVHERDGKVLIEQAVGHGKGSHFPIADREEHSTFYDTSWFQSYMAKYGTHEEAESQKIVELHQNA